ncbi:MAG: hypothetical protein LBC41_16965, partial [Clostridiales bacterium]|nr:hypothetical protein [Clostridiales bacterium]
MKLENPELENPKLEIPELKTPKLETPKLQNPELKNQIKKHPRLKNPKQQNPNPETTAADAAGVGIKRRPFSHSHATLGSLRRRLDLKDILDPDLLMEAASELSIINSFSSKHAAKELLGKGLEANLTPLEDMASALRQTELTLGDDADPDAIEALKAHGLPVTKKNLASLNRVLGLIPSEPLPDAAIAEILKKSHLVLSVIYKARHFFSTAQSVELADESMVPELKKLYERLGIEPSEELVNVGLFLLGANLPVTKSNISRVRLLKTLPDSVDRKKVLDKASSNLSRGIPLASIDLEFKGEKT